MSIGGGESPCFFFIRIDIFEVEASEEFLRLFDFGGKVGLGFELARVRTILP